jgi:hypothetical protein
MRLTQVAAALLSGGQVCEEDQWQLQYAAMLINMSQNQDSTWCQKLEMIDVNTSTLGFLYVKYITKTNQATDNYALNWLYLNGNISYHETILCPNNESVDRWNANVQRMNTSIEYKLMSRDSFEEVDDQNGHLKKILTKAVLNKFRKNVVPNHKLILKTNDICLVIREINGLGLANKTKVRVINMCTHSMR